MPEYLIEYRINIDADTPLEAALKAESYMRAAGSYRPVLEVTADQGNSTTEDLEEQDVTPETEEPEPQGAIVYDLKSDKEIHFDDKTDPAYAVRYAHVTEDQPELSSWFFAAIQDGKRDEIELKLPVIKSATTIACGDWVTKR